MASKLSYKIQLKRSTRLEARFDSILLSVHTCFTPESDQLQLSVRRRSISIDPRGHLGSDGVWGKIISKQDVPDGLDEP
jgi:hypothetical protein